jgi:single-stranded-DNA-specific exonuclease
MKYDRWNVALPDAEAVMSLEQAGFRPLAARTLARRGILTPQAAETLLTMKPDGLHDPFLLPDMQKAIDRLHLAAERKETAAVYGDYDADGVTATAVMLRSLRDFGINCLYHIPDREHDGYGLNEEAIESLKKRGVSLIVTVDTGCTAHGEVETAKRLGIDVIVTDHHECQDTLPGAVAVVNPRRTDSAYPFPGLAGVGVSFKLACALYGGWRAPLIKFADIVALGTIADIMPVTGENRLLITQGLKMVVTDKACLGLRALLRETEQNGKPVTPETVAFVLAPRINAAGRVGRADTALELLLADDMGRAGELARTLCEMNILRQSRENDIIEQAKAMADLNAPALVLIGENWPPGVAGIVAARLAEQYERPAFIACLDGDTARGSARGSAGVHLVELLKRISHLLEAYGGHEQAAGFTVTRNNLDEFKQAVLDECASLPRGEAVLEIDAEADPAWMDLDGLRGLEALSPFGTGFGLPVFSIRDVSVVSVQPIGGGKHLRLVFERGGLRLDSIWFHKTELPQSQRLDIAFRAEINRFRGLEQVQLRIIDAKPGTAGGDG